MSADPVVIVRKFKTFEEGLGLVVYLDPLPADPPDVGLRLSYSGVSLQGSDREMISLTGTLSGRGLDPGAFLSKVLSQSRVLAGQLDRGVEYPLSASLKAKAQVRLQIEGQFSKEEAEDRFDWIFQAVYRIDLSYNPAVLDNAELAG